MAKNTFRLITPGEQLAMMLEELGVTPYRLAKSIGKQPAVISKIINGSARFTPATSALIGKAMGFNPRFWLGIQQNYDWRLAERDRELKALIAAVKPLVDIAALEAEVEKQNAEVA